MPEIRPAASLTSNLLARRGDARPAMRRQAITHLHVPLTPNDDLGWNDHGDELDDQPSLTPHHGMPGMSGGISSADPAGFAGDQDDFEVEITCEEGPFANESPLAPMTRHLEAFAQRISNMARDTTSKPMVVRMPDALKRDRADARKAAFTLRLDPERHLRLRLLSALVHRSSQQLLIEALDLLLARHDKVEDLAGQVEEAAEHHTDSSQ